MIVNFSSSSNLFILLYALLNHWFNILQAFREVFFSLETVIGFCWLSSSIHLISMLFSNCWVSFVKLLDSLSSNSIIRAFRYFRLTKSWLWRVKLDMRSHFYHLTIVLSVFLSLCVEGIIMVQRINSLLSRWFDINHKLSFFLVVAYHWIKSCIISYGFILHCKFCLRSR